MLFLFFTLQMLAGLQPTTLPENEMAPAAVEKLKAEKVTFSGGQNYQKGLKLTTKRRRWLGACPTSLFLWEASFRGPYSKPRE